MKRMVYVIGKIKAVDPCELPCAVVRSQSAVAKWLNKPLRNVQRQFEYGCNTAYFGYYQVERVLIND